MELFKLPHTAKVQRVIPKNAFDSYTTSRQKKLFTDLISRITWLYKLSPDTVNLKAREVLEIQIFKVELKVKEELKPVLDIIDKAIPYSIIFILQYEREIYLSTSTKHPHPVNEDNAVIDWTFKSNWFLASENTYKLQLKKSIDAVFHDFCIQLSAQPGMAKKSLHDLVRYNRQIAEIEKDIADLQKSIKNSKQYKSKVDLNLLLRKKTRELNALTSR